MLSEISHKRLRGTLRGLYYFFQILKSSANDDAKEGAIKIADVIF